MTLMSLVEATARDLDEIVELYGRKAAGLVRMRSLGLRVPDAFFSPVGDETFDEAAWIEQLAGLTAPYSVRSGGRVSMPGAMRTVLNVGLDEAAAASLADRGMPAGIVEQLHSDLVDELGAQPGTPMSGLLELAFRAVHASKPVGKAVAYRRILHGDAGGTGVVVQEMRFGNLDSRSGSGIVFSHDPVTGADVPVVDFAAAQQGTAAVEGAVDVRDLADLRAEFPDVTAELLAAVDMLVADFGSPVDVEFTIEAGILYLLQCRPAPVALRVDVRVGVDRSGALAVGVPACTGTGTGLLVHADEITAEQIRERPGELVLLAETADLRFVRDAHLLAGIVVITGGPLCHLALVARSSHVPCLVGLDPDDAAALREHVGKYVVVDATDSVVLDPYVGSFTTCTTTCTA